MGMIHDRSVKKVTLPTGRNIPGTTTDMRCAPAAAALMSGPSWPEVADDANRINFIEEEKKRLQPAQPVAGQVFFFFSDPTCGKCTRNS